MASNTPSAIPEMWAQHVLDQAARRPYWIRFRIPLDDGRLCGFEPKRPARPTRRARARLTYGKYQYRARDAYAALQGKEIE